MIHVYYGTPGAGKSFGMLKDMVLELLYSQRLIVTNLPLDLGKLNEYMAKNHSDWGDDINLRVRLISDDEMRFFYSYRSIADAPLPVPEKKQSLRSEAPVHVDYEKGVSTAPCGVAYYIDEAHIAFDSRSWESTGPELTYYASQHRKLNDECVFATQHPDMLEKRLRVLAQDFHFFNNNGLEKVFSFFRKPSFLQVSVYRRPPAGITSEKPQETRYYKLNVPLANCYDTSAGIGITGRKMPEVRRKGGLPVWLLIIPVLLIGYGLMKIPKLMGQAVGSVGGEISKGANEGLAAVATPSPAPSGTQSPVSPIVLYKEKEVYMRGYAVRRGQAIVFLSDGREYLRENGLVSITPRFAKVMIDGKLHTFQRISGPVAAEGGPGPKAAAGR